MTIALYHSGGPLACIGSGRMWDELAAAADPASELGRFCIDGAGLADAGLADAAAATGTKCGFLLAVVLRSPGIVLPSMVWIDEWRAEPERAVVNVEPKITLPDTLKIDLGKLPDMLAALAAAIAGLKIENHVTLPPMAPTFQGGPIHLPELKPIIVGGDRPIVLEGVELGE